MGAVPPWAELTDAACGDPRVWARPDHEHRQDATMGRTPPQARAALTTGTGSTDHGYGQDPPTGMGNTDHSHGQHPTMGTDGH